MHTQTWQARRFYIEENARVGEDWTQAKERLTKELRRVERGSRSPRNGQIFGMNKARAYCDRIREIYL